MKTTDNAGNTRNSDNADRMAQADTTAAHEVPAVTEESTGRGGASGAAARRALLRTAALGGLSVGGAVSVLSMLGGGPTTVAG